MPGRPQLVYWDTSVFLDYFNEDDQHHAVIAAVLRDIRASDGRRLIATSTFTLTEVVHIKAEMQEPDFRDSAEELMDFFWNDRSVLRLVDLHAGIARRARSLQRHVVGQGGKLTASDAVHLATASWLQVNEMHSYDRDHLRLDGTMAFRIREPRLAYGSLFETPPGEEPLSG
jgi:predicted nucleic acid-binding protein